MIVTSILRYCQTCRMSVLTTNHTGLAWRSARKRQCDPLRRVLPRNPHAWVQMTCIANALSCSCTACARFVLVLLLGNLYLGFEKLLAALILQKEMASSSRYMIITLIPRFQVSLTDDIHIFTIWMFLVFHLVAPLLVLSIPFIAADIALFTVVSSTFVSLGFVVDLRVCRV